MENKFCQSCGMPLDSTDIVGTNSDQNRNEDYCIYCYENGVFTYDVTMDEMIDISLKHMDEIFKNDSSYNKEESLNNMKAFFPTLKRWKNTEYKL